MRRFVVACFLAMALPGCDIAEGLATDRSPPSPAMWELVSPEGDRAWLLGSLHSMESGTTWRTGVFDAAFEQSGALVLEVAELAQPLKLANAFETLSVTPGQGTVSSRVDAGDRARVLAALEETGYEDSSFNALETWAVALTLSSRLSETGVGVDRQLLEDRGNRPLYGLETAMDQYGAFDRLERQDQSALLVAIVDEADRPEQRSVRAEAWRKGDLEFLEAETHRGMLADPDVRRALIVDRNLAWLDDVAFIVARGERPLIAVGTGHVVGEEGLPALLAARGWTVRRIQ